MLRFHRLVTVVGARPEFIKAAVLSRLICGEYKASFSEYLVHTGQHYDENMSEVFFSQMKIPKPDINLEVGSGSHGKMTGEMLLKIEKVLQREKPHCVVVYGDTNSTLAGALAASKLNIPVVHIEAGLRSFYRAMPEEQNRVLTDHLSSILFCPTRTAKMNLEKEGIRKGVYLVGDINYDAALFYVRRNASNVHLHDKYFRLELPENFYLLTLHRAENTDDPSRLSSIIKALNTVNHVSAIFPVHPRTKKMLDELNLTVAPHIRMIEPLGFLEMLELEQRCLFIVTDSGGMQKEAYFLKKPCITLRDQTEWVETVESGWNTLVGANTERIVKHLGNVKAPPNYCQFYGNGDTGKKILTILEEQL